MHAAGEDLVGVRGEHLTLAVQLDPEPQAVATLAVDPRLDANLPAREIRREGDAKNARGGHALHPHRLPDAARAWIPDRMRLELPVLLAARLGEIVRIVFRADHDFARRVAGEKRSDVDGEGCVAAVMRAGDHTIDPDLGAVIDRAEVEQPAARGVGRGQRDRAAIPAGAEEAGEP